MPYEKCGSEVRCIADEVPFEIPSSWCWCKISTISSVVTKGTTPRGGNVAYLEQGIGFLRAENVAGYDKIDKNNLNYINEITHTGYLKRSILKENDILITIAGTLGRTGLVRKEDLPLNANQAVSMVRLASVKEYNLLYLVYAINSPLIQKSLTTQKKITAIPNLTLEIISDCYLPLPPLEEQHRIVEKIEELLPYIEAYEKAETQLSTLNTTFPEALKKSILQQAVMGNLVPQNPDDEPASVLLERIRAEKQALIKAGKIKKDKNDSVIYRRDNSHYEMVGGVERCIDEEIPFEIPESWVWVHLGSLLSVRGGKRLPLGEKLVTEKTDHVYIRVTDMKRNTVDLSDLHYITDKVYAQISSYIITKDDLYIVIVGSTIGKVGIIPNELDGMNLTENAARLSPYQVDKHFLLRVLTTDLLQNQFFDKTHQVGQPKLALERLKTAYIPLPPLAEQNRIVSKIEELFKICENL